jgi:bifunctional enzyme CysN/CysC
MTADPELVRHSFELSRDRRWRLLGVRGATVWLTGIPAAGKSTLASAVEAALVERGTGAYVLDGDSIRHGLSRGLSFSRDDRAENVRRVAEVACMLADAGLVAIVALVSPYADDREVARALHETNGLSFAEVHVDAPVEECRRRDPKGLYRRASEGLINDLSGAGGAYEPPASPDLRVDTLQPLADGVSRVIELVDGLLRPAG